MIVIDHTIISEDLIDKQFVCNLSKCKGACCVEGDSGAPLEQEETVTLENIYEQVKPYMDKEGIDTIEKFGKWMVDTDGDFVTPLIGGKGRCAYSFFDKNGIAKCAIEQAHADGKIDYKKPVSCHLYPVRVKKYKDYEAVNYDKWDICSPACTLGKELNVPIYRFVKEALIRKYGEGWYKQLEGAAEFASTAK